MEKAIFIEHSGKNENNRSTEKYQDIIHFGIDERVTMELVIDKLQHRYSPFAKDKGITIFKFQPI